MSPPRSGIGSALGPSCRLTSGGASPEWTSDGLGVYHRPDVPKVIDQIVTQDGGYSLLPLQTLLEPFLRDGYSSKDADGRSAASILHLADVRSGS